MEIRKVFTQLVEELFDKGEILKSQYLVNNCIPLDLKDDPSIIDIKDRVNSHINNISKWSIDGRPYSGTYATVEFDNFPKFVLARKKILDKLKYGKILDIGCYSCDFLNGMTVKGFTGYGIDIHSELMDILQTTSTSVLKFGCAEMIPYQDNFFDVVTAFDVLEHVIDFDTALAEIERVCEQDGLIIINLPRMTLNYKDESHEHMRMFDDEDINRIWGDKKDFKFEFCNDELGRPTSFITYTNGR